MAWSLLGGGVVIALVAAVSIRGLLLPMISLAVAWAMCVGLSILISSGRAVGQGEMGERSALRALSALPDDFLAVTNVRIPGYEQIGDLDIVVIGPPGVIVIEVKNFLRPTVVNGDAWAAQGKYSPQPMASPTRQLRNQVQALTRFLARAQVATPVSGVLAVNPNALVQIDAPPAYPIIPYDALAGAVLGFPLAPRPPLVESIAGRLTGRPILEAVS